MAEWWSPAFEEDHKFWEGFREWIFLWWAALEVQPATQFQRIQKSVNILWFESLHLISIVVNFIFFWKWFKRHKDSQLQSAETDIWHTQGQIWPLHCQRYHGIQERCGTSSSVSAQNGIGQRRHTYLNFWASIKRITSLWLSLK